MTLGLWASAFVPISVGIRPDQGLGAPSGAGALVLAHLLAGSAVFGVVMVARRPRLPKRRRTLGQAALCGIFCSVARPIFITRLAAPQILPASGVFLVGRRAGPSPVN